MRAKLQRLYTFVGKHHRISCAPGPTGITCSELYRRLGDGAVAFSAEPGQTLYVFDRMADLPQACAERAPWPAPRIAGVVAATLAELYPSFEQRGIDWPARTAAAIGSLDETSDDDALFKTLQTMLSGIEDPHLELQAEVAGEKREFMPGEGATLGRLRVALGDKVMSKHEWLQDYRRGVLEAILQGKGHRRGNDRLLFGRLGDIGYLNVLSMEGLSAWALRDDIAVVDRALDEAIAAFAGARAVVIDVSYNLGGYDAVSQRIAGRFADQRSFAYSKVAFGARDVAPQAFHVEPSTRARYLGPVYLLTSDVTVSAGEIFTLFMRALPNVVHVGGATRGALSDMIEKPLPNGWSLALPAEIYRDPTDKATRCEEYRREVAARGVPARRSHRRTPASRAGPDRRDQTRAGRRVAPAPGPVVTAGRA